MLRIEKSENPVEAYAEIISLMRDVYEKTGGGYPALEWSPKKPEMGRTGWKDDFNGIYGPFLEKRLKNDIDVMLFLRDEDILLGIIGMSRGTNVFEEYAHIFEAAHAEMGREPAFIEMLAVRPEHWGHGYGGLLLGRALGILHSEGFEVFAVSFPNLEAAIRLYLSMGARILGKAEAIPWSEGDPPADYVLLKFD